MSNDNNDATPDDLQAILEAVDIATIVDRLRFKYDLRWLSPCALGARDILLCHIEAYVYAETEHTVERIDDYAVRLMHERLPNPGSSI